MTHSQLIIDISEMKNIKKNIYFFYISSFLTTFFHWGFQKTRKYIQNIYKTCKEENGNAETENLLIFFITAASHIYVTITLRTAF